jgi:hypothetical protein
MVLLDARTGGPAGPRASWEFDADIAILTHSTTIQPRYQAVIHCQVIRQAARVVAMDRDHLRAGDKARIRWRWVCRPEYVVAGTRFVFREGKTKGIGMVTACQADGPEGWDATPRCADQGVAGGAAAAGGCGAEVVAAAQGAVVAGAGQRVTTPGC